MPIKGRVGRYANTGANCPNGVADQMWVIGLLNLISPKDGGAGGTLDGDHCVAGMASDHLYNAILGFQKKYFPAQVSGVVDPGGPALIRMETLASHSGVPSSAPPPDNGQWGDFQSGSVQKALGSVLANDTQLTHSSVVDILYATLENGILSADEVTDLRMVVDRSNTISERSKSLLIDFANEADKHRGELGPYKLATSQHIGAALVFCNFLKRSGSAQWPFLDRDDYGIGGLMRLAYPSLVDQADANLCGPAAYMFNLLQDRPGTYASYATELFEKAVAHLRGMTISPSSSLRHFPKMTSINGAVDWATMASLRDSENWFLSFDTTDVELGGATTMYELASWFSRAGYPEVEQDADWVLHQRDTDNMDKASKLFSDGYRVCLLIDDQMVHDGTQGKSGSMVLKDRHWVVLRSKIDRSGGNVTFTVFTWGENAHQVPHTGTLSLSDFLENYYGYVAAKP